MDSYDSRRITLDPGLTVLALRAVHRPNRHYPFVDRHVRRRVFARSIRRGLATWFPTFHTLLTAHRGA